MDNKNRYISEIFRFIAALLMVEARGIEPLSENPFMQLSTSVVYLLKFPKKAADKQAESLGSPNTIKRNGHSAGSFTVSRCPCESHGTQSQDRSRLKLLPVHYF